VQRSFDPTKGARLPQIEQKLLKNDIKAQRWELEALIRGTKISFGDVMIHHHPLMDWQEFYDD